MAPALVVFVVAHGLRPCRTEAPDKAVLAIFSPARLIAMQDRTGPCLLLELLQRRAGAPPHPVQHADNGTGAQRQVMERGEIALDGAHREAQSGAQLGKQARQADADAPLPQHRRALIQARTPPPLTARTPSFAQLVFDHLHGRWWRQLNDLADIGDAVSA